MAGSDSGDIDQQRVNVVVFGAGITGLTVAQELAERRFKVWVVEPTFDVNRHGKWTMAIGGMARTQYADMKEFGVADMSASVFPLASLAMRVQGGKILATPLVRRYIQRLEKPHKYGPKELLQFIGPSNMSIDALRADKIFNAEEWTAWNTRLRPEQFEKLTKYEPTPSTVVVVRRRRTVDAGFSRRVEAGFIADELTRSGARMFRQFLEYTSPGDRVTLALPTESRTSSQRQPSEESESLFERLKAELEAHDLIVSPGSLEKPGVARLETLPKEVPIPFTIVPSVERLSRRGRGVLTAKGSRRLREFKSKLVSGDVIEIHYCKSESPGNPDPGVPPYYPEIGAAVAERIRRELDSASVTAVMVADEVLLLPTPEFLSTYCLLPGEHGFRFFPAYYRHLKNTLRRVPTFEFDDRQIPQLTKRESGETVLDNLVNTPVQALAGKGTNPLLYPRCPSPSVGAIAHQLKSVLLERGYDPRDIGQFIIRLVRYMSTGSKRRALELDQVSWWQYLRGYDPVTGIYRFRYSDQFTRDLAESPRVLAAFDAEWGDAHTNGNTFVQLLLNQFHQTEDVDQVLNAPTSEAWFEHWEQYLRERLDVRFVAARLEKLKEGQAAPDGSRRVTAELRSMITGEPVVLGESNDPLLDQDLKDLNRALKDGDSRKDHKYFVMAVDAKTAEARAADLPPNLRVGVAQEIQGFERVVRGSPLGEEPPQPRIGFKYGDRPWDRFQTLTGIQFFFRNVTGVFDGHVYYMGAPWALSSINQQLFWRISLISRFAPYRGLLSADIGRFTDAWNKDEQTIAATTWEQIRDALRQYWQSDRVDDRIDQIKPTWFHLDRYIDLTNDTNYAPYLIPIVDDWQNRPCDVLFDPGEGLDSPITLPRTPGLLSWAPWGGYRVHWGEWLFAGTYMRHFTRMTTMEAANESGRHAVNALLDHVWPPDDPNKKADLPPRRRYSTAGNPLEPRTAYVPTPTGDYCHIWDMENYELADLVHLREIDDWLVDQGLPHACDLLGGEVIPSLVSYLPSASDLGLPTAADIVRALSPPFEMPGFQSPIGIAGLQSLFGGAKLPWQGIWPWPK